MAPGPCSCILMNARAPNPTTRTISGIVTYPAVSAFAMTDRGMIRPANEDAFVMADLVRGAWDGTSKADWSTASRGILLAVSDGMGGANAGEVASALSIEKVLAGMVEAAKEGRPDGETLKRVMAKTSREVHGAAQRVDRKGMGATFTAVLVTGQTAYVAQVGDSRAYLLRKGGIEQVTHDQSYVQLLVDAGVLSQEQAERSPRRNVILQVMGQAQPLHVVLGVLDIEPGDRLLLCSDGLTNVVEDDVILEIAAPPNDIAIATQALILETKDRGAPDNVTVVLAEIA